MCTTCSYAIFPAVSSRGHPPPRVVCSVPASRWPGHLYSSVSLHRLDIFCGALTHDLMIGICCGRPLPIRANTRHGATDPFGGAGLQGSSVRGRTVQVQANTKILCRIQEHNRRAIQSCDRCVVAPATESRSLPCAHPALALRGLVWTAGPLGEEPDPGNRGSP